MLWCAIKFLQAMIQAVPCLDAKTSVQKCKVSVSVLLSQTFIPKYWYRFLKSGVNATLMDRHSGITLVNTGWRISDQDICCVHRYMHVEAPSQWWSHGIPMQTADIAVPGHPYTWHGHSLCTKLTTNEWSKNFSAFALFTRQPMWYKPVAMATSVGYLVLCLWHPYTLS